MNDYELYKEYKSKYKALKKNKIKLISSSVIGGSNQLPDNLPDSIGHEINRFLVDCLCMWPLYIECDHCRGFGQITVFNGYDMPHQIRCHMCNGDGQVVSRYESEEYRNVSGTCEDKKKELVDAGNPNVECT